MICLPRSPRGFVTLIALGWLAALTARAKAAPAEQAAPTPVVASDRLPGWKTPVVYPRDARVAHEQGRLYLQLTTDATGKIVQVTTAKVTTIPRLQAFMARWIPEHWHGTPNTTIVTFITFQLQ